MKDILFKIIWYTSVTICLPLVIVIVSAIYFVELKCEDYEVEPYGTCLKEAIQFFYSMTYNDLIN